MEFLNMWRWYFEYLAAIVKVANKRKKVELTICHQDCLLGQDYVDNKIKNLLPVRRRLLNEAKEKPINDDLFGFKAAARVAEIERRQNELKELEAGIYRCYIPPTYINRIKEFTRRNKPKCDNL